MPWILFYINQNSHHVLYFQLGKKTKTAHLRCQYIFETIQDVSPIYATETCMAVCQNHFWFYLLIVFLTKISNYRTFSFQSLKMRCCPVFEDHQLTSWFYPADFIPFNQFSGKEMSSFIHCTFC